MASGIVSYEVDDSTRVAFEVEAGSGSGWAPAGADTLSRDLSVRVRDAVGPAVEAAQAVLDRFKTAGPDTVEVTFGIKVNGEANWIVAKAATEGTFEVTLTWNPGERGDTENPVPKTDARDAAPAAE